MNLKIITNNNHRQFLYRDQIPEKVLKDQFDWLDGEEIDGFIKYRDNYYHVSEFMRIEHHSDREFSKWDGYSSDSFFSGIVIKLSEDMETYQIGTYLS